MPALRELFARYDVEFNDSELRRGNRQLKKADQNLEKVEKGADDASDSLRDLAGVIAGAFAINEISSFVSEVVTLNRELSRNARVAGISSGAMVEIGARARLAGIEVDTAVDALKDLQINAREAMTEPDSERARFFRMLGLDAQALAPIIDDQVTLFDEVLDRLNGVSSASQQVQIADELASDALVNWLGVARMSRVERRQMINDARRLSVQQRTLNRDMERAEPVLREFNLQWEEFRAKLVTDILPGVTSLLQTFTRLLDKMDSLPPWLTQTVVGLGLATAGGVGLAGFAGLMAAAVNQIGILVGAGRAAAAGTAAATGAAGVARAAGGISNRQLGALAGADVLGDVVGHSIGRGVGPAAAASRNYMNSLIEVGAESDRIALAQQAVRSNQAVIPPGGTIRDAVVAGSAGAGASRAGTAVGLVARLGGLAGIGTIVTGVIGVLGLGYILSRASSGFDGELYSPERRRERRERAHLPNRMGQAFTDSLTNYERIRTANELRIIAAMNGGRIPQETGPGTQTQVMRRIRDLPLTPLRGEALERVVEQSNNFNITVQNDDQGIELRNVVRGVLREQTGSLSSSYKTRVARSRRGN